MAGLFDTETKSANRVRAQAAKAAIGFSDVARSLSLGVETRQTPGGMEGYCDCPACSAHLRVEILRRDTAGRCRECGEEWDAIALIERVEGVGFGRALARLEEAAGLTTVRDVATGNLF